MIFINIENIDEADEKRGLYYVRPARPHHTKGPNNPMPQTDPANHKKNLPNRVLNIEALLNTIPPPNQEPEHTNRNKKIIGLREAII